VLACFNFFFLAWEKNFEITHFIIDFLGVRECFAFLLLGWLASSFKNFSYADFCFVRQSSNKFGSALTNRKIWL